MSNPWIEHVKKYAKTHQLSYSDALLKAKESYTRTTGGSRESDIVRVLVGTNKFDINRIRNPSKYLIDKAKKTTKPEATAKIETTKPKTTMNEYEYPNKYLKRALDPIISGDQNMKFERLKIMYSCIIQKGGTSEQREKAKKIIEQFENDIKYRKSLFTNHIKFFNFYNVFKVELKKILKMKDGSPQRNKEERNLMSIFWTPGSSAYYEDDDSYMIGGEGIATHK